jgi:ABC-type oligopeptide transport system substrate-binding subunit
MSYSYPVPFTEVAKRDRPRRLLIVGTAAVLVVALAFGAAWHPSRTSAAHDSVTVLGPEATTLDPAEQFDVGSAQVTSQLFECLTAVDSASHVQPALAASWETQNGGKRVVFHLRPDLTFSDGSALKASDVVASWMRVLSPDTRAPLASLIDAVAGARAYRLGSGAASAVGIHASGDSDVTVDLATPSLDFPVIVSSASFAIVPSDIDSRPSVLAAGTFVGSGAYVLSSLSATGMTLSANPHYWAGAPAIGTVNLVTSLGDVDPIAEFEAGKIDYYPLVYPFGSGADATWMQYDRALGPSLRVEASPSVEYYGFNTTKAPFSDVHVRRAFELGIDWRRIVTLEGSPLVVPATGMVPPDVPGHSSTDFGPKLDLAKAKSELAAAGYPNGTGFPKVVLVTAGGALDSAIIQQLHDNLGIDISSRFMQGTAYDDLLSNDPPAFWLMGWVADYPGADDFLGILLGSDQPNNFARWSNADFDGAIDRGLAATDASSAQKAYDDAQQIVLDQAPVIPVDYYGTYALVAQGLLGALPNSEGLLRYAGLAWATGS